MTETYEYQDPDLRNRIVSAALKLFASEGFHAVPVPRIAEKAGVGVGSIYRVAASKTALADIVFEDCIEQLKQNVLTPSERELTSGEDVFFYYWARVSDWLLASPEYMRFMVLYRFVGPADRKSGLRRTGTFEMLVDMFVSRGWVRKMDFDLAASLISGPLVVMTLDDILTPETLKDAGVSVWRAIRPD